MRQYMARTLLLYICAAIHVDHCICTFGVERIAERDEPHVAGCLPQGKLGHRIAGLEFAALTFQISPTVERAYIVQITRENVVKSECEAGEKLVRVA